MFRSNRHIYAQLIDDVSGDGGPASDTEVKGKGPTERAQGRGRVDRDPGEGRRIEAVVFDRGGRLYHGRWPRSPRARVRED